MCLFYSKFVCPYIFLTIKRQSRIVVPKIA